MTLAYQPTLRDLQEIRRNLYEKDLSAFIKAAWPCLEPGRQYVANWHIDAIAEHLTACMKGEIRNLLINIPPRHMKSLSVSVFWPCWVWAQNVTGKQPWEMDGIGPHTQWLFSSHKQDLSTRDSVKCRYLIQSEFYRDYWGNRFHLVDDQNQKTRFQNNHMGLRLATTSGTGIGEGGDYVICDDPHDLENAESDTMRESTLLWWDQTMSTRLNDAKRGRKIIVMQRLHERDLSGHVLAQGGYTHLCLPAEYEPGRKCVTSIGWQDPRKTPGELLWPQQIRAKEITEFKLRLGPMGYAGQFLQRPVPHGGAKFKTEWFRFYKRNGHFYELLNKDGTTKKIYSISDLRVFVAMDPAGTDKEQNNKACYTVMQAWGVTPEYQMLLLGQRREQWETPTVVTEAYSFARQWEANFILVEKDGLGLGIFQALSKLSVPIIPALAQGAGDKLDRSEAAVIRCAAGAVYFELNCPYWHDLANELEHFPNSEFKDQVDAFSWAARQVTEMGGPPTGAVTETTPQPGATPPPTAGRYKRNF